MKFLKYIIYFFFLLKATSLIAQNENFKNYTSEDGLPSNSITDIIQDNLGYIWFASNKGITQFDGNNYITFSRKEGLKTNYITKLATIDNGLLIGSPKSLFIKQLTNFQSFESKKINCISKIGNHIFLGTKKGIYRLRDDFLSPLRTNFQIDLTSINDIQFDGEFYWVATQKALWKIDNLLKPKLLKRIDLANYTAIIIHNKQVITSTFNSGIKVIVDDTIKTIHSTTKKIKGIKKIKNQFWIYSNSNGIEVLDLNFSFIKKINKYNTLKTNAITAVFQDSQHNIWIATNDKGIYKQENKVQEKSMTPLISFEDIEVVYKTIDSINFNSYKGILQIPPGKNHLAFTYKSIDINNPKKVLYRYKLNGNFSPWSNNNSVNLANLKSGNYTFSVQSKLANKQESKPIHFQFFIDKPFYKKNLFQWLAICFLLLLGGFITYKYIKKIRRINKENIKKLEIKNHLLSLEQKALQLQMNPHFIFNVLNGIKALGNSGKLDDLNTTINKFSNLLRSILNTSRKEEVNLSDEIATLKNYISLEQQMSSNLFTYDIQTQLTYDAEEVLIPPMLIQPFIENSIKHGIKNINKGKITVKFYDIKNHLHCEIIDNGVGVHQSQKNKKTNDHASLAIKVTKERIKNLTSNISIKINEVIENDTVKGTKVWFKIPLKTDF
ncbi:histidine kinase [Tenacibaculum sp. nBUS_03]|uniref:histidine kinase n=1 Tax=Tenacibaculum sp. nBUS_03 TaxID=3395320 RepID=UPI003EBB0918